MALILTVALFRGDPLEETLLFALILRVAAIPVALPAVLSVTMAVGAERLARLKASLPIYVICFVTIAFTIFFPSVLLWLPKTVFPESVGCFGAPAGTGYICP